MVRGELFKIILVTLANWVVSIGITMLNKLLLSYEKSLEKLPVTILWLQSLTAVFISVGIIFCQRYFCQDSNLKRGKIRGILKSVKLKETVVLSLISVVSLLFNTVILKYYTIALFTISRTLGIVFTVVFTRFFLKEKTPPPVVMACALISIGYLASISADELNSALRIKNMIYSTVAGVAVALCTIYVKLALPDKKHSAVVVVLINNLIYLVIFLVIMIFSGEFLSFVSSSLHWNAMGQVIFSGSLGFSIAYLTKLQVQITSPVTFQIVSAVRLILQVTIGVLAFREPLTQAKIVGTCFAFAGSLLYGAFKTAGLGAQSSEPDKKFLVKHPNSFVLNKKEIM